MSQPAAAALAPLPFELVYDDGVPVEDWLHAAHLFYLPLLLERLMAEQGRDDFFVGNNTFVYYSVEQAREVADEVNNGKEERAFRGPDIFWVGGVDHRLRHAWISWEEDGRLPDVIIELLSPSTARKDRTEKKDLYARRFRTPEYFMYEAGKKLFEGLRLVGRTYEPIPPDKHGRFWSEQLGAYLGLWHGTVRRMEGDWIRLFRADGSMVPTEEELAIAARRQAVAAQLQAEEQRQRAEEQHQRAEKERQRAEAERQRAEAERQRAEAAEAELARLRVMLEGRSQES